MAVYLVTGAAGFIGSKVAELLLSEGHTVLGIDNMNHAYDVRLKKWRLERLLQNKSFSFYEMDIADKEKIETFFKENSKINAIINLAARAGVRQSVENPWVYFETNVTGTLNLLEMCRKYEIKKFVLASSSSVYGQSSTMPYKEDTNTDEPLSPYASSKKSAETLCYTYHYLYGLDITVFRYFTVYGPAGRPDMSLFRFVQWIMEEKPIVVFGDGKQSRDFTYIDDIARGTILGLKFLGYKIINLGSDKPVVLMDAIRLIEKFTGKKAEIKYLPRHPADVPATWADIRRASELLGWRPETHFEDGIRKLVDWYKENREWAKEIKTDV
ncbi:MAG: nucleotide sugar epimerase [Deltaproteobacteria bacterium]|nr:MAG: nucleotide sugar epimerase [Deltaproteobacteria bacterium]